ncbi:MAG: dTDP-4-dehydrorhamnose reductase [Phycisphaerae bacterium]|nr:dTDP-4-dehydrorhamnose reductase [Phycisphaerae bacterium]MDD5381828.1 dTDP-4-dehydrorhamnose reductase [Phycisphaerae bacterium]
MAKNRIAILGGKGMLGSDLALACQQHRLIANVLDLPEFDITNEKHLSDALKNVDAVINCAAYTNVEKAESESELSYKVNAEAVGRLGFAAKQAGVWVLHISTDFVFDGTSGRPYVETDKPNPVNVYGASKLAGEELLVESRCSYCIMRVEWTYGSRGSNFVTKMIERAKTGKSLKVVDDQIGSPTATVEVAKTICNLLPKKPQDLFHFASTGYVSRFEMAKFIFDKLNMPVDLNSCKTDDFPTAAVRPLNSRFNCSKIKTLLDEPIESWQVSLERFLERL